MTAAVQTIWCELLAGTLADAGVGTVVISPGSRSTPLVAALASTPGLDLVTIIDERAAAFFALGAARATGLPAVLVCTSGTAAAHYLPAIIEASLANIPLVAITADRPPELQHCGASQTIDQVKMYGSAVRGAFDVGASTTAVRALRRTVLQALTLARGPHAGPVHLEVPLKKPLEPAAPSTEAERALAAEARALRGRARIAPPSLVPEAGALAELGEAIAGEPDGVIIAGALPAGFPREAVLDLARRAGYPVIAEAASQLRFGPRDGVVMLDHVDLVPLAARPRPKLVVQLGAEPVAASWPAWLASLSSARRFVLSGATWADPDGSATVILGDVTSIPSGERRSRVRTDAWLDTWRGLEARAAAAVSSAIERAPTSETAVLRAVMQALPAGTALQIGNSLPIRTIDHVPGGSRSVRVLSQRGAAGIDGLIASAAGATRAGAPVLLVLGDVSFAHDLGGILAARAASAPLAVLVLDNGGGQIFAGLPVARANLGAAFEQHFVTAPGLDPALVATSLGARGVTATTPAAAAAAVAAALASTGPGAVTVIHAPVSVSGAHDVRRNAMGDLS